MLPYSSTWEVAQLYKLTDPVASAFGVTFPSEKINWFTLGIFLRRAADVICSSALMSELARTAKSRKSSDDMDVQSFSLTSK